jgi:hypothetical protein
MKEEREKKLRLTSRQRNIRNRDVECLRNIIKPGRQNRRLATTNKAVPSQTKQRDISSPAGPV